MNNDFNVNVRNEGPAGWVEYQEEASKLSFPWERTEYGFSIDIPMKDEWDAHCEMHSVALLKGKYETVIRRIAEGAARAYWGGSYRLGRRSIDVLRPRTLFSAIKAKFLN